MLRPPSSLGPGTLLRERSRGGRWRHAGWVAWGLAPSTRPPWERSAAPPPLGRRFRARGGRDAGVHLLQRQLGAGAHQPERPGALRGRAGQAAALLRLLAQQLGHHRARQEGLLAGRLQLLRQVPPSHPPRLATFLPGPQLRPWASPRGFLEGGVWPHRALGSQPCIPPLRVRVGNRVPPGRSVWPPRRTPRCTSAAAKATSAMSASPICLRPGAQKVRPWEERAWASPWPSSSAPELGGEWLLGSLWPRKCGSGRAV